MLYSSDEMRLRDAPLSTYAINVVFPTSNSILGILMLSVALRIYSWVLGKCPPSGPTLPQVDLSFPGSDGECSIG